MTWSVLGFLVCAALIVFSGSKLSYHGDRIARLTGWSRAWLGLILMAAVTSLPELLTGISAVTIVKEPDLAAGDVFGSCVFNLLLLSLLDARLKRPLSSLVRTGHVVAALFGIILMAITAAALVARESVPALGWFSVITPLVAIVYLIGIRSIFRFEQQQRSDADPAEPIDVIALRDSFKAYGVHAAVVVCAALFLPHFGEQVAHGTGMGPSFFGTSFLAAATSLPELVVSLSAIRLGSYDLAVGNLLGSNVFNMLILGIDDLFYVDGPLLISIEPVHLMSLIATMAMTAVVGLGMMIKPVRKAFWVFSLDALAILLIYIPLMIYLFRST